MPPAFTLSQDQTLKFISTTAPGYSPRTTAPQEHHLKTHHTDQPSIQPSPRPQPTPQHATTPSQRQPVPETPATHPTPAPTNPSSKQVSSTKPEHIIPDHSPKPGHQSKYLKSITSRKPDAILNQRCLDHHADCSVSEAALASPSKTSSAGCGI